MENGQKRGQSGGRETEAAVPVLVRGQGLTSGSSWGGWRDLEHPWEARPVRPQTPVGSEGRELGRLISQLLA